MSGTKGRSGRRRLPRSVKETAGTYRPDRETGNVEVAVEAPNPPSWLSREAAREWRRVVPLLLELEILGLVNRAALACYCTAWSDFHWASSELKRIKGKTYKTPSGQIKIHPAYQIQSRAMEQIRSFASEFGMTPSSIARVQATFPDATPAENSEDAVADRIMGPVAVA
ncbi:MAG: phage terminase small subunit P27 family [Planctomycetes bacterium]|nr:phage terminase small subunit P27 family [Planctomycetota bacterium]